MHRDLRQPDADHPDGASRNEARSLVKAIVDNRIPEVGSPAATSLAGREQLERLAGFSSTHDEELSRIRETEAQDRRQRENLEWCAKFSTESESKLRNLL